MEEVLSLKDVIRNIQNDMNFMSGDEVTEAHNNICDREIKYDGDSMWSYTDAVEDDDDESVDTDEPDLWSRDDIQFPRLLAEIAAVSIGAASWSELEDNMNLDTSQLQSLFDRAQDAWERIKDEYTR